MKGFFLPKDLSERLIDVVIDAIGAKRLNLGLFFDKYVLWWKENDELKCNPEIQMALLKKIYRNFQDAKKLLEDPNIAGRRFREKITENVKLSLPFGFFPLAEYKLYKKRMDHLLDTLKQIGYHVEYFPKTDSGLPLNWRLIINLGAVSVYETSLLFHRNYSIPYIPGSAIKGVTRHWAVQKFAEKIQNISYEETIKEVDIALENGRDLRINVDEITFEDIIKIFGTKKQKGKVMFFDALPVLDDENKDLIVLDVMNVHYKPYYEKEELPGDWHSPTPVFFLVVEKGTKFRFVVASKNGNLAEKAMGLLKEAAKKVGIGAKTSAGYGYFDVE